jgi:predicted ribosomally synthesized peptide with SipW-like signal peptide
MKNIIKSLAVIAVTAAMVSGTTYAFFSDTETSEGNTFTAGGLDLKIDLQCDDTVCGFPMRDLPDYPSFFQECDVKPGDEGEVTISWHVLGNKAYGRLNFVDIFDWEYGCNEPEAEIDKTCGNPGLGEGEFSQHLAFTAWLDQGSVAGWQCPADNNGPCQADLEEGDNILNGVETPLVEDKSVADIMADGGILLGELDPDTTYYLGLQWSVPDDVGNILQTDSVTGKIVMEVIQARHTGGF